MTTRAPRSVVVVDDHDGFRPFVRTLLTAEGWNVIGEAADGEHAVQVVHELHPDVVLLDVQLPDHDGFWVAEELARDPHPPAVVLMSSRDASDYGSRVTGACARGFLRKIDLSGAALAALASPPD